MPPLAMLAASEARAIHTREVSDTPDANHPEFRRFLDAAALWRAADASAADVVDAAVQALLAGIESPAFILIAGLGANEAETELSELLGSAINELGLSCLDYDDPENDVLAAAAQPWPVSTSMGRSRPSS